MLAEVRKCAQARDIKGLRYIFVDCLDVDPTFEKYREDYEYCKSVEGLFEPHQPLGGISDRREEWTAAYWGRLKTDLMKNFSEIRFEHMIKVAQVVYADKISRLLNERSGAGKAEAAAVAPAPRGGGDNGSQAAPAASGGMSQARLQEKMLEEKRRELEEENRRIEAQQASQRARIEAARRESESRRATAGQAMSKKALGIVLAIIAIVVAVLIIILH